MKTPMLVAVRLRGKRGYKESFVQSGGETYASLETWPPKQEAKPEREKTYAEVLGWNKL